MLLKVGGESNQHLYRHSLNCGGFRPATTPNGEYSPVMDSNGTCLDVVRYFSRLQSCATWSVQDLPDSRIKPQVSVLITSEECVPSVPLPGWSYVCWVEHVNSSLFSTTDTPNRAQSQSHTRSQNHTLEQPGGLTLLFHGRVLLNT